jgi:thiosulfate/3-mercaptopyruvate sulfurtransferase
MNAMRLSWSPYAVGVLLAGLYLTVALPAPAAEPGLLVDAAWLGAHLNDANLRIVDMVSEPEAYQKDHIPGAAHLDVDDSRIAVPAGGFRLPTEDEAARLLGALGIGADTHVVIYDDAGGLHAARLFFTLDVFGHARVSLLDGGIQAWQRAKRPVTTEIPKIVRTDYRPKLRSELVASAAWVRDRLNDPTIALVDARTPAEYAGKDVRAKRGGHIPGAVNIEWYQNLRSDGTFKPLGELRRMYAAKAVTPDKTVVTYCQTHHRAAHAYFVLRLLGYPRLVGYDRSWIEWGNRDDLPIAR